MRTPLSSYLKSIATPGFFSEKVASIGGYAMILLLAPLDVITGSQVSFHVLYLFALALIALHSVRNDVVFGATALSISLQLITLFTFADASISTKTFLFLMIAVSNSAFVLMVRSIRKHILETEHLSTTDPLTQLFNRRALENVISAEVARQRRYGGYFSIALIDLDGFKGLNDLMGHKAGDAALILTTTILRAQTRQSDTIARLGGDEFVIIMPSTHAADCEKLCHTLCQKIGVRMGEELSFPITASIGYSVIERSDEFTDDVLIIADRALYKAKASGKGGVVRQDAVKITAMPATDQRRPTEK